MSSSSNDDKLNINLQKSSERVCKHMNADHSASILAYAHMWYDINATAAIMTSVTVDGFLLDITMKNERVVNNVLIKYTTTLHQASEVRKIAVAMHFEAFHHLGFTYKWRTGYYRSTFNQVIHHVPKHVFVGGSVVTVGLLIGVGWFIKKKYNNESKK